MSMDLLQNGRNCGPVFGLKKGLLLLLFLFLFFVLIRMPADRVWPTVLKKAGLTGKQVQLAGGEGSWLAGSFKRVRVSGRELGAVGFRFRPLSILTGALRFDLKISMADGEVSGAIKATPQTVGMFDLEGVIPVHLISKIAGLPGIEPSGTLKISDLSFSFKNGLLNYGSGEIMWQQAGLIKPYRLKGGSLETVFKTDAEGIKINCTDKGGDLMLKVAGTVTPEGSYGINSEFAARDSAHPDLVSFLKILGEPGPDGRVRLSYRGKVGNIFQ